MSIKNFRDLIAWQRSMVLAERIYALTARFPRHEQYGLAAQLRRAAVSIPSNVAEGHARQTGHYLSHLDAARGSSAELQTQVELAARLKMIAEAEAEEVLHSAEEVSRLVHGLAARVRDSRHQ